MTDVGQASIDWPACAAVFGASGGIGAALCDALIEGGCDTLYAGSRRAGSSSVGAIRSFPFDLLDEASIAKAAQVMRERPPELAVLATGVLTLDSGEGPERTLKRLDPSAMEEVFRINTIGPAIIAKHILPLLPRDRRSVFAALSARVGSISDNGLGGWDSYRASKAALNMLVRNWSIEMRRTHSHAVIAGIHPGTVDTALSEPFQANLSDRQLTHPREAAANILNVLRELDSSQSGQTLDWKGEVIPA